MSAKDEMPKWIPRLLLTVFVFGAATWLALWLLMKIKPLLILLVASFFLSFAIEPLVNWLEKAGWRRGLATGLVLFGLVVFGIGVVGAMTPLVIDQTRTLIQNFPSILDRINEWTQNWFDLRLNVDTIKAQVGNFSGSLSQFATNIAGNLLGFGAAALSLLFQLATIGLFTFYIVADGPKLRRALLSILPPERRKPVLDVWEIAIDKTGGYFYSRLILAVISALGATAILLILGVPYAVPLGLWVGLISQFIPTVGTYIAAAVPLLVVFASSTFTAGLIFLGYVLVYQQIENYLLVPRITAKTMELHPAVAFGSVIAGASIAGAMGAFLALPAAAIIQASASTYVKRYKVD